MTAKPISEKGTQWFLDSRFGMFIHWGLYSIPAHDGCFALTLRSH